MPDPNQTDPNQTNPTTTPPVDQQGSNQPEPVVPPVLSPSADLPPMPPAFQSVPDESSVSPTESPASDQPTDEPKPEETSQDTGSAAPSDTPPVVSSPKKKFGSGKIIATILGILLLVGGVGTGVYLTQQNQNISEKAYDAPCTKDQATCSGYYKCNKPSGWCHVFSGTELGSVSCATGGANDCISLCQGGHADACQELFGNAGIGEETCAPPGTGCVTAPVNGAGVSCNEWHWTHCINEGSGQNGVGCDVTNNPPDGPPDNPPSNPPGSPTPPGPTASCLNVKAYTGANWVLLNAEGYSALRAGDEVNFCVAGTTTGDAFDKAQFMIGSSLKPETTATRPGSTDFCQSYTILESDINTPITVKAKIHSSLGWFGESI